MGRTKNRPTAPAITVQIMTKCYRVPFRRIKTALQSLEFTYSHFLREYTFCGKFTFVSAFVNGQSKLNIILGIKYNNWINNKVYGNSKLASTGIMRKQIDFNIMPYIIALVK